MTFLMMSVLSWMKMMDTLFTSFLERQLADQDRIWEIIANMEDTAAVKGEGAVNAKYVWYMMS